ncbi:MAG: hypothetical protein Q8Q00_02795 [Dehalococcoidia bacterium]|nr:hypothetical protein [Dehalococcoidia bacterium]
MPDLQSGRKEELRRLRRWLDFSERLDRLIDASEPPARMVPATTVLASAPARHARGLRAQLAAALARAAVTLHREAAAAAALRPEAAR